MSLTNRTALGVALVAGIAVSGCGTAAPETSDVTGTLEAEQITLPIPGELPGIGPVGPVIDGTGSLPIAPVLTVMHTFIPQSLEIEDYLATSRQHGDANLFTGADPVDGTPSVHTPKGASPIFLDWNDLGGSGVAQHRYLDPSVRVHGVPVDPNTFGPGGQACLGARSIDPSYDLTYVAVANNQHFAYLAAQRADNEADSAVAFLFTQLKPQEIAWTPCRSFARTVRFNLTAGAEAGAADVLLVGHFADDGHTKLFRSYIAVRPGKYLLPNSALDTGQHWAEVPAISAAAGNVTRTAPGSFGVAGLVSTAGTPAALEPNLFVELAVPMSLFAPRENGNRTYYLTVFSRDRLLFGGNALVDIAGPMVVDMAPARIDMPIPPLPTDWIPPENPKHQGILDSR